MGEHVEFPTDAGGVGGGYLATPVDGGAGPALIVLGDVPGVERGATALCDRFAAEGFTALALPWHGEDDGPSESEAGIASAQFVGDHSFPPFRDVVPFLEGHALVRGRGVGVLGLGEGGFIALMLAASAPEDVQACVVVDAPVMGSRAAETWGEVHAPVECHFGVGGEGSLADDVERFEAVVSERKLAVTVFRYPDAIAGFFDETGSDVHADAAHEAWIRTLSFLRAHLG